MRGVVVDGAIRGTYDRLMNIQSMSFFLKDY